MDSEKRWVVDKIKQLTPQAEVYKEKIENWICVQDKASVYKLRELFEDEEFVKTYVPYFEAFHFAYIVVQIINGELRKGSEARFIRNGRNLADLENLIRKLRFALWRMEFLDVTMAGRELCKLCLEYDISAAALHQVIRMNAISPKKAYLTVMGAFLENGRADVAKGIVACALEAYPEDADFKNLLGLM